MSSWAKCSANSLEVAAFEGEIQFAQERAAELPDDCDGLVESCLGSVLFRQLGQAGEDIEVGHDLVHDAGVLDFDDDLLARVQPGQMDLGDGSRGQWRIFELRKQLAQRFAELGFNRGPNRVGRIGRGGGLQVGQFPGHFGADEVGPRAEHLAELDEGGAEFGECQAHALLDFEVGDMLAVNALEFDPGSRRNSGP